MKLGLGLTLGRPGASVFDPLTAGISGLIMDFWATSGIALSGADVTDWTERSNATGSSDATTSGGSRPTMSTIGGRPALNFAAGQKMALAYNIAAADWTIFLVYEPTIITGGQQCMLDFQTGRLALLHNTATPGKTGYFTGGYVEANAALGAQVFTYRMNATGGNSASMRRNGTNVLTGQLVANRAMGGAGQSIGNTYTVDSQFLGKIARITAYQGNLTTAQCQTIERGFGSYYGITVA